MKKIHIFIAAAVAVFSIVSCSKEKIEQPSAQKDNPSIEISVSSIDGTIDDGITTKAAKPGWSAGNKINIWFDSAAHEYGDSFSDFDDHFNPELILTFNGSAWTPEFSDFFDSSKLKSSGTVRAIYESTNDFVNTFHFKSQISASPQIYDRYYPSVAAPEHHMVPMIVSANTSYLFDSGENKISSEISSWEFLTKVQVLITGLTKDKSYYYLDAVQEGGADGAFYRLKGFQLCTDGGIYPYEYDHAYGTGGGTLSDDGMAFYFYDAVYPGVSKTYKFKLEVFVPGAGWSSNTATFENKTISTSNNKITCIKINKSEFGL